VGARQHHGSTKRTGNRPRRQDSSLARAKGWAMTARVRCRPRAMQRAAASRSTTRDGPDWSMLSEPTPAAIRSSRCVDQNLTIRSMARATRQYHDYVLEYDPVAGRANLVSTATIDSVSMPGRSHFLRVLRRGFGHRFERHRPRVLQDGGRTTCTGISDGPRAASRQLRPACSVPLGSRSDVARWYVTQAGVQLDTGRRRHLVASDHRCASVAWTSIASAT